MTNDADAAHAKQQRTAVFGVVEPAAEIIECLAGEQCTNLSGDRRIQRGTQSITDKTSDTFTGFKSDIADESITDYYIGIAVENVAAFDVADEIDRERFQ